MEVDTEKNVNDFVINSYHLCFFVKSDNEMAIKW